MTDDTAGIRERLTRQGEEALGRAAQELMSNSAFTTAVTQVFSAREKALEAQALAMGALNLPSAADLERLTRRVRSVSQRLEGIEDGVDRLGGAASTPTDARLASVEKQLAALTSELAALRAALPDAGVQAKPAATRTPKPKPKPKA